MVVVQRSYVSNNQSIIVDADRRTNDPTGIETGNIEGIQVNRRTRIRDRVIQPRPGRPAPVDVVSQMAVTHSSQRVIEVIQNRCRASGAWMRHVDDLIPYRRQWRRRSPVGFQTLLLPGIVVVMGELARLIGWPLLLFRQATLDYSTENSDSTHNRTLKPHASKNLTPLSIHWTEFEFENVFSNLSLTLFKTVADPLILL